MLFFLSDNAGGPQASAPSCRDVQETVCYSRDRTRPNPRGGRRGQGTI